MLRKFVSGKNFLFSCDEDFKPFKKVFGDKAGRVTEEELDKFLSECQKFYVKLAKSFPEITWNELVDIDTLNDIAAVIRQIESAPYLTISNN